MKALLMAAAKIELVLAILALAQAARAADDMPLASGPYKPDYESLKTLKDPEWFRDAKFGIYTHWGPVTVGCEHCPKPAEWYGNQMYLPKQPAFEYHRQRFGDQKTVGYKDIIPLFKAEKFNADQWADLFVRAGAKFAGPVAVHHDNFANWDSSVTRWNSKNMGPHRDITGELEKALRGRGLKFITTFHHGFAWRYFEPSFKYDGADGKNADLYTEPHDPKAPASRHFQETWLKMVDEVLRKYQPDLIWFDFEFYKVISPEYQQKLFAHAYNLAAENGREIGVCHKSRDIHKSTGILDIERGREDRLTPYPWLTDTAVGPWFHHDCLKYRSTTDLVHVLVDIVSKNGCLLLNVGPRSDGTFTDDAQKILLGMGDWLKVNGEAIYATRPYKVFGEGPTKSAGGGFSERKDKPFTSEDIRFTQSKDGSAVYAIVLGLPTKPIKIASLAKTDRPITRIELLGAPAKLKWKQQGDGLVIQPVKQWPCKHAVTFRIGY